MREAVFFFFVLIGEFVVVKKRNWKIIIILLFIILLLTSFLFWRLNRLNRRLYRFWLSGLFLGILSGYLLGPQIPCLGDICKGTVLHKYNNGVGISVSECDTSSIRRGVLYGPCGGNSCPPMYTTVKVVVKSTGFGPFIAKGKIIDRWGVHEPSRFREFYLSIMRIGFRHRVLFYNKLRDIGTENVASLGTSILLGETNFNNEFESEVRYLGLLHIVAISGINIVYLQNIVRYITAKMQPSFARKIDLVVLFLLYLFVGNNISLIRAILIILFKEILFSSGIVYKRQYFFLVLAFMVVFSPSVMQNVSFWLVFAICIGIYVLIPSLHARKKNKNKYIDPLIDSFILWISVLPVILRVFKRITILNIFLGIFIDPILELATMLGYITFIISGVKFIGSVFLYTYVFIISIMLNLLHVFHTLTA